MSRDGNWSAQAQVRTLDLLNTVQALSAPGSPYAALVSAAFPALRSSPASVHSGWDAQPGGESQQQPPPQVSAAQRPASRSPAQRSGRDLDSGNSAAANGAAASDGQRPAGRAAAAADAGPPIHVGDAYYAAKDLLIRVRISDAGVFTTSRLAICNA